MAALFLCLVLYLILAVGVSATAILYGAKVERSVAIAFLMAAAVSMLASAVGSSHWHGPNWGVIAVDGLLLGWLMNLALRSDRFWPLWITAFQLDGLLAHFPAILSPSLPMRLYATTQPFWAFPFLLTLLIGTLRNPRMNQSV